MQIYFLIRLVVASQNVIITDVAVMKGPQTTEQNLDFFFLPTLPTSSRKLAKLFTRKVCHAIHLQNLAQFYQYTLVICIVLISTKWTFEN